MNILGKRSFSQTFDQKNDKPKKSVSFKEKPEIFYANDTMDYTETRISLDFENATDRQKLQEFAENNVKAVQAVRIALKVKSEDSFDILNKYRVLVENYLNPHAAKAKAKIELMHPDLVNYA